MYKLFYIAPLYGININSDLGAGIQLDEHEWIGNDPNKLSEYVNDEWRRVLGSSMANKILNADVYVYGELTNLPEEPSRDTYVAHVSRLKVLLDFLWIVKDNAVNIEMCVFSTWSADKAQWSNPVGISPAESVTMADGSGRDKRTEFGLDEIQIVAKNIYGLNNVNVITHVHPEAFKDKSSIDRFGHGGFFIHLARRTKDITGKIALYCSAFEAMLTTSTSEVSHQLAERVALLIGRTPDQRMEVYQMMKEVYQVRSMTMHGQLPKPKGGKDISDIARLCDEYLRKVRWVLMKSPIEEMSSTDSTSLEYYFQKLIFSSDQITLQFQISPIDLNH